MGFGPYRRRQVLDDPAGIRLAGWRQGENRCRELPANDQRRCLRGSLGHGESWNVSWQAFQVTFVLEPRRPAAGLVEAPFALLVKKEHKHPAQVLQLQSVKISRAANKQCAKFGESFPKIIVIFHSLSSGSSWRKLPFRWAGGNGV